MQTDAKAKLYNAIIMEYKFHFDTPMTIAKRNHLAENIFLCNGIWHIKFIYQISTSISIDEKYVLRADDLI